MKTVIKLTLVTIISMFIFSCSTTEVEETPSVSIDTTYLNKSTSNLVEKTETYFKAIEDNVSSEDDMDYAEGITEELFAEWVGVLEQEGGIAEAENALKILEENNKASYQSKQGNPCLDQFKSCVIGTLRGAIKLILAGEDTEEVIDAAWVSIFGCLIDHMKCMM